MKEIADYEPKAIEGDVECAAATPPKEFTDCREWLAQIFGKDKADNVTHGEEQKPVLAEGTDQVAVEQGMGCPLYAAGRALQPGKHFDRALREKSSPNAVGRVNPGI